MERAHQESSLILPDFVLAGAPKCGTSSLYGWLSDHPQLCGSTPKEPFYFMDADNPLMDAHYNVHGLGLEGWSRSFASRARAPNTLYFEATTHLIYQQTALSILPGLPTRPKLIFLLRDPIERLVSSFVYTQNNLAQVKRGFTIDHYFEMLANGNAHELDRFILSSPSAYVLQRDLQYSHYWPYLQRWREAVGSERMLVLQFEQLIQDPTAMMRQVCDFLQISARCFEHGYDYPARNLTMGLASTRVHRWAQRVARVVPPGRVKRTLSRTYYWMQQREPERLRARASSRFSEALRGQLEADTLAVAREFALDLRLWKSFSRSTEREPSEKPASHSQRRAGTDKMGSGGADGALLKGKRA